MNYIKAFCLLSLVFFFYCSDNSINIDNDYLSITMDEIYQNKIVNYIDSLINLETKVYWENCHNVIGEPSDSLYASLLKLKFENADDYISDERFKNQQRGNLFIVSEHIYTQWYGFIEKYYFENDSLSNNIKTYVFQGRIQFRDWLDIKDEYLQDSTYINQWNNVVYWSQTFEFQVDKILDKF